MDSKQQDMRKNWHHWFVPLFGWLIAAAPTVLQAAEVTPIHFGILSTAQPGRIYIEWGAFVEYLGEQLGRPVEIVVPRGFGKMKQVAAEGGVDFFYINSHVYYRLKQEGLATAIAQMQNITGKTTSRSEFFVRADSGITDISQLRGKSIAFISPMGAGGYLAPRAHLYNNGIASKDAKEVFAENLSNSIHKVLLNEVNSGAMCGVNYKLMTKKVEMGELKVIAVTDDYAEDVIGARKGLDPDLVKRFQQILRDMDQTDAGKQIFKDMEDLKIQKFIAYDERIEDITRKLLREAKLEP